MVRKDVQFDLAYVSDVLTDEDADRFTTFILEHFDPDTTEIHVNFRTKIDKSGRLASVGWNPCSESTFDHLYILKDKHRIAVCWVEDED